MNAIVARHPAALSIGLIPTDMTSAMRLAEMMSAGKLMPAHLQKSPGDCLMVVEQAMRWQMSPFAVAQETSVIQGKMMFGGKLVAAAVNTSGVLDGRLAYDFAGEGQNRTVTVSGLIRGEATARTVEVLLSAAKTNNQWWVKTPDQMLSYHGARVWARRHAPEVMLGVYSPEEFDQSAAEPAYAGQTIDLTPKRQPATRLASADLPMIQTDPARDLVDDFIKKLAATDECAKVRAMAEWAEASTGEEPGTRRGILLRVREAPRPDLDKMLTEAIDAARLRCPDLHPDADLAGDEGLFGDAAQDEREGRA